MGSRHHRSSGKPVCRAGGGPTGQRGSQCRTEEERALRRSRRRGVEEQARKRSLSGPPIESARVGWEPIASDSKKLESRSGAVAYPLLDLARRPGSVESVSGQSGSLHSPATNRLSQPVAALTSSSLRPPSWGLASALRRAAERQQGERASVMVGARAHPEGLSGAIERGDASGGDGGVRGSSKSRRVGVSRSRSRGGNLYHIQGWKERAGSSPRKERAGGRGEEGAQPARQGRARRQRGGKKGRMEGRAEAREQR
ncbi:hypothetical protein Tco_0860093 [Tanacetum coccineum]|uniref:Uncharacterized protein n=1 Tax=Tanacetum coccineum TaxID=301880 RepID=A0ABQ5BHF4_9ASTR